jgi:hypothetical protein
MAYRELMNEIARKLGRKSGKSVDELLANANGNDIDFIQALDLSIRQKSERTGEENLSDEERIVLAIQELEGEVNNGGYNQFFFNSSRKYAPIIVDALLRIGCVETAEITKKAVEALGVEELTPDAVRMAAASENEVLAQKLDECDQLFYKGREDFCTNLIDFVKANKNAIQP